MVEVVRTMFKQSLKPPKLQWTQPKHPQHNMLLWPKKKKRISGVRVCRLTAAGGEETWCGSCLCKLAPPARGAWLSDWYPAPSSGVNTSGEWGQQKQRTYTAKLKRLRINGANVFISKWVKPWAPHTDARVGKCILRWKAMTSNDIV